MPKKSQHTVRIGLAGWSYEDWKGIVYPKGMPRALHPLTYLSEWFDTIEINTTFYRPPDCRHCASWVEKVAERPRFRFAAKLWQRFTHERDAWPNETEIRAYTNGIAPLHESGKLGALLVQFPWSFKRTVENRQWLMQIMETFGDYPLVLEIRHSSWDRPEVYEGLAHYQAAFCNIDQPQFRNSIKPSAKITARAGYIRLHGRNADNWFRDSAGRDERYDYLYSDEELQPWIDKIRRMRDQVDDLYVVTNNHYRGQAVVNALEIAHAVNGSTFDLPDHLLQAYPRLNALCHERS